ncbi:MAG: serine/threonine protein phosphatase [Alphaproteobacteria bacterium]|nr:serine/threonine protein phosphatase [Alphaproteobacteria bacterium]
MRRSDQPDAKAKIPNGTVAYAIGDIHGRVDLLEELQAKIQEDARTQAGKRHVVVYLGDYVDRGLTSREVIDRLIEDPLPGFESVHLKGNHEDAMLKFLHDTDIAPGWLAYGGDATLYSYGVTVPRSPLTPDKLSTMQAEFARKLPGRHLEFLSALDLRHEEGDYFFVHAGVRPGRSLEEQSEEDLLWIRDAFLFSADDFGKIIVHGHTISPKPEFQPNRIGIDTGAFASGVLTCLVLDGTEQRILQTG